MRRTKAPKRAIQDVERSKLLETLPDELLSNIFLYTDKRSFLCLRAVSSKFTISAHSLWFDFYNRAFKCVHTPTIPPKDKPIPITNENAPLLRRKAASNGRNNSPMSSIWKTLFLDRNRVLNFLTRKKNNDNSILKIYKNANNDEHYTDKGMYWIDTL